MPEQYYKDALRLAQKERRSALAAGEDPYLPVLDELIPQERFLSTADLGLVQVPTEFIVGTRTAGRTTAFSRSFLPLLGQETEFAGKWERLCKAHIAEGIRDPIKVYEYLNRFYVEEGNKRVSVLKYFGAVSIPAHVIRVLPERDGSPEVELYYEFVEFYQCSRVNFIEFSRKGGYADLQRMLGKAPDGTWTDEERTRFSSTYHYFSEAYEQLGGGKLSTTVGDAMLACMRVYGYQELRFRGPDGIREALSKMWEEITLQEKPAPIDVKLDPEEKKAPLLTRVLSVTESRRLKVAFLHDKDPNVSGWTYGHELGRQQVQRVFKGQIETVAYFHCMDGDPLEVIEQAIREGCSTIFTTSPVLLPASLRAAVEHPDVNILNCSLNKSHRYIRTYYARMYEVKFIIGALAGSLTENDRVGYLCDYPIFGQIAGINAFALGAQMVNPRAKVYLDWSSVGGAAAATKRLAGQNVSLISSQDLLRLKDWGESSFGLFRSNGGEREMLAMPVWRWGTYYERILRQILNKTFQTEYEESSRALNYYWGMSSGVVDLCCMDALPESGHRLGEFLRRGICMGSLNPFAGPMRTQDGWQVAGYGQDLGLEQIMNMDWLAENVIGSIPVYDELNAVGKATVDMVGVDPSTRDSGRRETPSAE